MGYGSTKMSRGVKYQGIPVSNLSRFRLGVSISLAFARLGDPFFVKEDIGLAVSV